MTATSLFSNFHATLVLEEFQRRIVTSMSDRIRGGERPLLLRSPTGSGKTLMIGRVLNDTVSELPVVWFWFAPYSNLVTQTRNALGDHCPALRPYLLSSGRQYDHRAGDVLIANVQQVASSSQQRAVFTQKVESIPTLPEIVARARAAGLKIGLVIDEAHIGVSSETEFGRFCRRLDPDRMILATATPRDQKLNSFLAASGYGDYETFTVSRDEAVEAHLNKRYIAAFVYRVNEAWQSLADLQRTVLKRAWLRHREIKEKLRETNISTVPLLLVQVANGDDTIKEAREYLINECRVPLDAIGSYEGKDNDPGTLTYLAQNPTKEVLIFKEAAGTGFDAPRAFTLVSTKNVSDTDFATQFMGRIMRVDRQVRAFFSQHPHGLDPDLDTGYVYLANGDAQMGFEQAAHQIQQLRSKAEGALEKLHVRQLADGSAVITNRPTAQGELPIRQDIETLERLIQSATNTLDYAGVQNETMQVAVPPQVFDTGPFSIGENSSLFGYISQVETGVPFRSQPRRSFLSKRFGSIHEVVDTLSKNGFGFYPLRGDLVGFSGKFQGEKRPSINDKNKIISDVVRRIDIAESFIFRVFTAAMNGIDAREVRTELTSSTSTEKSVGVEIDRARLAAETEQFLRSLPQMDPADVKTFLVSLMSRISSDLDKFLEMLGPDRPMGSRAERVRRDTAFLLVRAKGGDIRERFHEEISNRVELVDLEPVPAAMMFPSALPLHRSSKNVYGVLPPTQADYDDLPRHLTIDERAVLKDHSLRLADDTRFGLGAFDGGWVMNQDEVRFARALDQSDFVLWWARNPDRKPYSISVVRADQGQNFYPDFIVCVRFWDGDEPQIRLLETKDNTKDAANKARRPSKAYGRVIFLTRNNGRLLIVNPNGSLGGEIDANMRSLKDALMQS